MRLTMILAATLALAGCGGSAPTEEKTGGEEAVGTVDPKFTDGETKAAPPPATDPACAEKGVMCAGPLLVRAEGFNLFAEGPAQSDGDRYLKMRGTLVVTNRSGDPVKFAVLYQPITATLDNGVTMDVDGRGVTGMTLCGQDGTECLQGTPDRFQMLAPSESPARIGLAMSGRSDGSQAASLPEIATAGLSLQLYAVGGDNAGRALNIQIPQIAVRNQLKQ